MRKLLLKNSFAMAIAMIICYAVDLIVQWMDWMLDIKLLICALFGIVSLRVFKRMGEEFDKRYNVLFYTDIGLIAFSIVGMLIYYYSSFYNKTNLKLLDAVILIIQWLIMVAIIIEAALLMRKYSEEDQLEEKNKGLSGELQRKAAKGWQVVFILALVYVVIYVTRSFEITKYVVQEESVYVLVGTILTILTQIALGAVLLGVTLMLSKTIAFVRELEVKEDDVPLLGNPVSVRFGRYKSDEYTNTNADEVSAEAVANVADYDYKKRAIVVVVSVVLVVLIQSVVRYIEASGATSNTLKIMSQKVLASENDTHTTSYDIIGYIPAADWPTVTTLEEIKAIQQQDTKPAFVIETDRSNIQPISMPIFKGLLTGIDWNRFEFLYGTNTILRSRMWKIRDYKITLSDGNIVYATYSEDMLETLGDGVVKLPISFTYNIKDYEMFLAEDYEYRHVLSIDDRDDWMLDTPVVGSYIDRYEFGRQIIKNAGIYYGVIMVLFILSLLVSGRFLFKDVDD